VFLIIFCIFVFYFPNALGDPQNYIRANPLQTPPEIVPEWYFLPFYAMLRSVPDILFIKAKLAGVLTMFGSIGLLFILPWLDTSPVRSARFRPVYKWWFWLLVIDVFALGAVGAHRPEGWWIVIGRFGTLYYYIHFLLVFPLLGIFERPLPLPTSISAAVTKCGGKLAGASAPMEKP
jgi:quinol-cytochrome oxidoreductase complex cytochrome b subunit